MERYQRYCISIDSNPQLIDKVRGNVRVGRGNGPNSQSGNETPQGEKQKNREMTTPRDCFGQDLDYAPPTVVNGWRGAIARGCVVGGIFSSSVCFSSVAGLRMA